MKYRSPKRNFESGRNASRCGDRHAQGRSNDRAFCRRRALGGAWIAVAAVFALVSIGCSESGIALGLVEGVVTLDGQPLPDANLEFQPLGGSPSYARTDKDGHYEMQYSPERAGTTVGKHLVRIYTFRGETTKEGRPLTIPETLPEKYHEASEMFREVTAGRQEIDFKLFSSP